MSALRALVASRKEAISSSTWRGVACNAFSSSAAFLEWSAAARSDACTRSSRSSDMVFRRAYKVLDVASASASWRRRSLDCAVCASSSPSRSRLSFFRRSNAASLASVAAARAWSCAASAFSRTGSATACARALSSSWTRRRNCSSVAVSASMRASVSTSNWSRSSISAPHSWSFCLMISSRSPSIARSSLRSCCVVRSAASRCSWSAASSDATRLLKTSCCAMASSRSCVAERSARRWV